MISAHSHELPLDDSAFMEAVDEAKNGRFVYLTRDGKTIAAIVPAKAIEALEDAEDLLAGLAARDEPGPCVSLEDLMIRYADDLAAYPASPEEQQ